MAGATEGLVAAGGMRLYPLAGKTLSFGYLFASHPLYQSNAATADPVPYSGTFRW